MSGSLGSYYDVPATGGLGGVRALAGLGSAGLGCGCSGGSPAVGTLANPSTGAMVAMSLGAVALIVTVIVLVEGR